MSCFWVARLIFFSKLKNQEIKSLRIRFTFSANIISGQAEMITKIYIFTILNMCFTIFLNSAVQRFQYANINRNFDGMVEFSSPLSIIMTSSSIECSMFCTLNDKCLTFFYNSDTKQCVRHSKDFNFQVPSGKENGWSYYITRDGMF